MVGARTLPVASRIHALHRRLPEALHGQPFRHWPGVILFLVQVRYVKGPFVIIALEETREREREKASARGTLKAISVLQCNHFANVCEIEGI